MKCEKCGFIPNPGDQVCINCGTKLSVINVVVPEVEKIKIEDNKKHNIIFIILLALGIIMVIIVLFLIIKFLVLKG